MRLSSGRSARIAVDAMGGDFAPSRVVDGALAAARHSGVAVTLVGRADAIAAELARHDDRAALDVTVVDAPDVIGMDESPAAALRRKPGASIRAGWSLHREWRHGWITYRACNWLILRSTRFPTTPIQRGSMCCGREFQWWRCSVIPFLDG